MTPWPRAASVGALALAALVAGAAPAEPDEQGDAAADLQRLLADVSTFAAEFEQVVANSYGEVLQTSTGRMRLQRPGRLRWEVDAPYPQLLVADGRSLWVFDPDLEQASVQPLAAAIEGTPAAFLIDAGGSASAQFHVRRAAPNDAGAAGHRFVLTPRDAGAVLREATLSFSPTGAPSGIDIVDHLNQRTRIAFTAARLNPVLESTLFDFEVPAGIDVIGDVPPPGQDASHPEQPARP